MKLIEATSTNGVNIDYYCKSIRAKHKGRRCPDFGTSACKKCDLCVAVMSAKDARRLLGGNE